MVDAETKRLLLATTAAALAASLVLVGAVLPAEYGVDPTGFGALTGFSRLAHQDVPPAAEPADDGSRTIHAIDASWRVRAVPVLERDGFTDAPFGTTQVSFPLNLTNLSRVSARLDWVDDDVIDGQRTAPDLFELTIKAPKGRSSQAVQAENGADGRGSLNTTLAWRSLPSPRMTEEGLLIPQEAADESGHGEWTVVVRLYAARGVENGSREDPGNDWTLTVSAEVYEAAIEEREGSGGDRVTLNLGPGRGVEYKFRMNTGARLTYAWNASGPVYWDLHAEEDGKDPDDFTRYREGTGAKDDGSFTAPFNGRHGWFFHNRGDTPVTLTLETSGDYEILGVV